MTQSSEPSIAVLFHSGYGHTAAVAQHVANGAGAGARLVTIDAEGNLTDEDWQALAAADAIVFGCTGMLGCADAMRAGGCSPKAMTYLS